MDIALSRPAVVVPAPIITALAIALGYGLNDLWPGEIESPLLLHAIGYLHNIIGGALLTWCFLIFIRNRTTIIPSRAVSALVIEGPYRYTRNPMYVALALIHLGVTMTSGILWYAATFALSTLATQLFVIAPEERYLQYKFTDAYRRYCAQVPRWF